MSARLGNAERRHQRGGDEVLLGRRLEPGEERLVGEELPKSFSLEERQVAVPEVARPPAERQGVDCQHDRAVPGGLDAPDETLRELGIAPPVELEPARWVDRRNVLERRRGRAGEDERDAGGPRGGCYRPLGVGMDDREDSDGREEERRRRVEAQHVDGEVALGRAGEHARPERSSPEGVDVGPHRLLRARPARHVVVRGLLEQLART